MATRGNTEPSDRDLEALKERIRKPGSGPYAKVGVYGQNGSGKTRLAGSGPNVLLLDVNEEGDRSIKDQARARVLPISKWEEIGDAYWYLKSGKHPFKSVSVDTTTEMNALALSFVLAEAENRDPTREKAMPDRRTWGRAGQLMRAMLMAYRNLPMHVVFTAQERIIRDDDTGEIIEICPDLPGSSRGVFMGSVGILGRLTPKEVKVRKQGKVVRRWEDQLLVGPSETIRTKDRTNQLGIVVKQPTMAQIIEIWNS